jgi:GcrA cell cycle regulator
VTTWTTERVEALKKLWAEGHSGSVIGEKLGGLNRAQVIGKVHRLGLASRATTARQKGRRPRPASRPRMASAIPTPQRERNDLGTLPGLRLPEAQAEDIARIATLDLEPWHCRWPVGDPQQAGASAPLFCGTRKQPGLSYCEHHARRAYQRPPVLTPPAAEIAPAHEMEPA